MEDYTKDEVDNQIYLNTRATQLTRVLLPVLARNGPSSIVNVPFAGCVGLPYLSMTYSGFVLKYPLSSRKTCSGSQRLSMPSQAVSLFGFSPWTKER